MNNGTNGDDDRVREAAYYLWVNEGRPEGQADRHWRAAKTLVEQADAERKDVEGEPPGERHAAIVAPTRNYMPLGR